MSVRHYLTFAADYLQFGMIGAAKNMLREAYRLCLKEKDHKTRGCVMRALNALGDAHV